jgi:hypothetical protein
MPAVTIDHLDIGIYIQYAKRMQLVEQVQEQFHYKDAASIPASALIVDLYPKLTELDLLLGVGATLAPWALFYPPKEFSAQRKTSFAFHRLAPIFGRSYAEIAEEKKLNDIECSSDEEEDEKSAIRGCIKKLKELNELLRYIGGHIGQFLQG